MPYSAAGPALSLTALGRQYLALTKPRVNLLISFCAVIGMCLSVPGMVPWQPLVAGTLGITLVAFAAAAINCLVEAHIDANSVATAAVWHPHSPSDLDLLRPPGWCGPLCLVCLC
jgi:heme O synthase-like polyprenyltransferase